MSDGLKRHIGVVVVLRRSLIALFHLRFERQRADASTARLRCPARQRISENDPAVQIGPDPSCPLGATWVADQKSTRNFIVIGAMATIQ
jgi:hypothetical protein